MMIYLYDSLHGKRRCGKFLYGLVSRPSTLILKQFIKLKATDIVSTVKNIITADNAICEGYNQHILCKVLI